MGSPKLPAGAYFVGDPCYAFDYDAWDALMAHHTHDDDGARTQAGHLWFAAASTAYGDGVYRDQHGREYSVDAGMIGVVPAGDDDITPAGMHRVTFTAPFTVDYVEGTISIGPLRIPTSGDDEDTFAEGDVEECANCGAPIVLDPWAVWCDDTEESICMSGGEHLPA